MKLNELKKCAEVKRINSENYEYCGYKIFVHQDSDDFYWLNYEPELPKGIDAKHNKSSSNSAEDISKIIKSAIDKVKHSK